ncbi:MAG: ComF family protein [Thermodesulfobacteriota bacterium]
MKKIGQEIISSVTELLFPASCLACGQPPEQFGKIMLCRSCLAEVRLIDRPLCKCCGRPFHEATGDEHLCGLCLKDHYHFDMARALVQYRPPITTIISRFKYHGQTTSLKSFQAIQQQLPGLTDLNQPDLIIPIPLHLKRLRQRGFNQALLLARALYPNHQQLIDFRVLERHRFTEPQTGLSGKIRRKNLKNAFRVKDEEVVKGKRVLLVDDVFTTGTTVNECAKVLKKAGSQEVQVLTIARVD